MGRKGKYQVLDPNVALTFARLDTYSKYVYYSTTVVVVLIPGLFAVIVSYVTPARGQWHTVRTKI